MVNSSENIRYTKDGVHNFFTSETIDCIGWIKDKDKYNKCFALLYKIVKHFI
jgi:hypothetical protein